MQKSAFLSRIPEDQFIVFPESVGLYNDYPQHAAIRPQGEFTMFNIHLVTKGKGYVRIEGQEHELKKGDAFIFAPNQAQHYYSSQEEPWEVYWLHFYGEKIKEFLTDKGFYHTNLWTINHWDKLQQDFEILLQEADRTKLLRPSLLSALAYAIVTEFAIQAIPLAPRKESGSSAAIAGLLPEIQARACEPFDLRMWADKANISTFYFCKQFRKLTQQTPMDFVSLCRIREAKQLLIEDREKTVAQIAAQCGYPSVSYFIQRFKKQEGLTPMEYRKNR